MRRESLQHVAGSYFDAAIWVRNMLQALLVVCFNIEIQLRDVSQAPLLYTPQRGVQWKRGVVIHMMLYTMLLYTTTPIRCTPLPLHPPVMNTHLCRSEARCTIPGHEWLKASSHISC